MPMEPGLEDRRNATAGEPRGGTITVLVKALANGYHKADSLASRKKPVQDQPSAVARRVHASPATLGTG